MKMAVLGCGPAGMMAAHACELAGYDFDILSRPDKSRIGGAQYLHMYIPELTPVDPDGHVLMIKRGSPEVYGKKVYNNPDARTSWYEYDPGYHSVWNMRQAYDSLWERYSHKILPVEISWDRLDKIVDSYTVVFSAVPLRALVPPNAYAFSSQAVFVSPGAPCGSMEIVYNGDPTDSWYRCSNLFGHASTEWPEHPGIDGTVRIHKPLASTCNAWPEIVKVGRYGRWEKRAFIHDAFWDALTTLSALDKSHVV